MISQERDERPRGRLLFWSALLSIALHALLVLLAGWLGGIRLDLLIAKPQQRETVVASTAVRIERRPIPQPRVAARPPPTPAESATHPRARVNPAPPARARHELVRQTPNSTPQPTPNAATSAQPATFQQELDKQEQTFSQEIARLRARDNPLSIATKAPAPAAAYRRTYFDVPGHHAVDAVQVQLIPLRHWFTATNICYYARYVAQYTRGGNEAGTIPWPVCYPIDDDKIAHPPWVHDVPVPVPPSGYVLPAGTYLTPLLARIYANRVSDKN